MSQTAKGRRTPLTLGPGPKSRKNSADITTDKSSRPDTTIAATTEKVKEDQLKMKVSVALPEINVKATQKLPATNTAGQKNSNKNGTAATKDEKPEKQELAAKTQNTPKPSPSKSESSKSSATNGNHKAAVATATPAITVAAVAPVATPPPSATTTPVKETNNKNGEKPEVLPTKPKDRESPRQKELRDKEEQRDIDEAIAAFKAAEDLPPTPPITITPATPDTKSQETPVKKSKTTPASAVKESTAAAVFVDSIVLEKDMRGFNDDNEEMESLRVTETEFEDSPMPRSKVLKMKRVSPFRRSTEIQPNVSALVNLSTVSEQSTEYGSGSPYGSSMRITGRKGMRPLRETTFRNLRETYRAIPTELNDSVSSMNATLGSEVGSDSFRTPVVAVLGRKRMAADDIDEPVESPTESPKKARLDFSGFFGIMASPVTMLRNKFSRAKLQCSTPRGVDVIDCEDIVNVEAAVSDEVSGVEKADIAMEEVAADSSAISAAATEAAEGAVGQHDDLEAPQSVDDIKEVVDEEEQAAAEEAAPKRSRCVIM